MLNELGVLLGVSHKIKRNKNHIYQWLRGVCFVPIIGTHTTKPIKNNKLNSSSLSSYDLLLRDCMTNSCRYG